MWQSGRHPKNNCVYSSSKEEAGVVQGEFLEKVGRSFGSWQGIEGTPKWGP